MKQLLVFLEDVYLDIILYIIFLAFVINQFKPSPFNYSILLITFISIAFWIVSRLQLGDAFSLKPKAKKLVTTGIYSKIRNPIYLFTEIANIGIVILINNKYLYFALMVHSLIQLLRAKKEQDVLQKEFGQAYLDYKSSTWF